MKYYYNNVPGFGLCRNNLIYTSLVDDNKTTFVQWYYNDKEYHRNQNEVVDPALMQEKWEREVKYLLLMTEKFPQHVPEILDIDYQNKKIYLSIQDVDFWELAGTYQKNYDKVLPDWQEQMLEIFQAHRSLGLYKFSLHPSSYFIVNGKLKSINYFFTYHDSDHLISVSEVLSHISKQRRVELFIHMEKLGIDINQPTPFKKLQELGFNSFSNNYPTEFINKAKKIYE